MTDQACRVCEEIVDFVRELDGSHCRDFWIPLNAFSLTSATTFLMRSALTSRGLNVRNPSLQLAKAMIEALQSLRCDYDWDIADNCLASCRDLVEKIEFAWDESNSATLQFEETMFTDMDFNAMQGLFTDFTGAF